MNKVLKISLFLALAIGIVLAFIAITTVKKSSLNTTKQTSKISYENQPIAPTFTGINILTNKKVSLKDYNGKIIILDFWATWCPPCRAEIPHFVDIQNKYKDSVQIIGISLETNRQDRVREFADQYGINYPIIMATREIVNNYGNIKAIPTTFIIDNNGKIVQKYVGFRRKEVFINDIKRLLPDI